MKTLYSYTKPCLLLIVLQFVGCSFSNLGIPSEGCKTHTYIDLSFPDYLTERFHSKQYVRMAIVPFDVPESFAPAGNDSTHYGRKVAEKFQLEFHKAGIPSIVELFNRDRWPGKRAEFFSGNYGAIQGARDAGYDLVMVGYLEELTDDENLNFYTKIIDTQNQTTVWHAKTKVYSKARAIRSSVSQTGLVKDRPDLFAFPERTNTLAECTVSLITNPEGEQ